MKFTPEDLSCAHVPEFNCSEKECVAKRQYFCDIFNLVLKEKLEKAPVVYHDERMAKHGNNQTWFTMPYKDTHKARLVEIEEIK